jgi:hypothetical protein
MKLLTLCFLCFAGVRAGSLFDQSPPNGNAADFVNFRVADDFTLASNSLVDGINFWYSAQFQTDLSSVTYAIYNDAGGALGSVVSTGTLTPVTSYDSTDDTYFATLLLSTVSLGAGTYWLELHGGASLTDDNGTITVWWDSASDNASYMALQSSASDPLALPSQPIDVSSYEQQAFQIDGTAQGAVAPEPWSAVTVGAGLLIVVYRRFSRSNPRRP